MIRAFGFFLISVLSTCASTSAVADNSIGIHGMVLAKVDQQVIASHLPLHNSIHAHQLVMTVTPGEKDTIRLMDVLDNQQLITIRPQTMSLTKLRMGQLNVFSAEVYLGHFERGGELLLKNVMFTVSERLLDVHIHGGNNNEFFLLPVSKGHGLLVHHIGSLPSFDQIIEVSSPTPLAHKTLKKTNNLPVTRSNARRFMKANGLRYEQQWYLEFDDFVAR